MSEQIRVGGIWLQSIGPWGELVRGSLADGGCGDATWSMNLPQKFAHPALRRGKIVEIKRGGQNTYKGVLAAPEVSVDESTGEPTWNFTANGLSSLAGSASTKNGYLCLDGSFNATTVPDTAIDAAIGRGLPWQRPSSFSTAAFGTADQITYSSYLGDLLDAQSQAVIPTAKRWGVDENGNAYQAVDPTTPSWYMTPGSGRFGLADDQYASDVWVRYWNGSAFVTAHAQDAVAAANYGTQEYPLDATGKGTLTGTQATNLGAGLIAKGKARLGWTNPLSPSRFQLTTAGGAPAPLWQVKGQQMVRLHGVINEQGQPLPYVDFVIGETSFNPATEELVITPVGMVARDLASIIANMQGGPT